MRRWIANGLAAATLVGLLPGIAMAGSGGRKNTAIGLSGAALYTWFNGGFKKAGRRNTALVLTAASVSAWHKYKKAKRAERQRARLASYSSYGYTRSYRSSYYTPAYNGRRSYGRASRRSYGRASRRSYTPASHRIVHARYGPGVRAEL